MNKYNIIILALIIVIIALIIGVVAVMPNMTKKDTNLTFVSNSTLIEGDSINIKLTDSNGTAIKNQTLNITITGKNNTNSSYSITTNEEGIGFLKVEQSPGEYIVTVHYGGNNEYESSNSSQKLTIEAQPSVSSVTLSNDYSSNDEYNRDYNPNMPGIQNMYRAY